MRHLIAAACMALATTAYADVTLEYQDEDGKRAVTFFIKGDDMRMETHDDDAGVILFNARSGDLTILQPRQREYIVMDQQTMERIQQQMRQAMQMMERFGMDPAQMGLGDARVEGRHVRTGNTRTVAGHRCEEVRYEVDGKVETIACVASPDRVGVSGADWNTMKAMFEAMTRMAESMLPDGLIEIDMAPLDGILIEARGEDGSDRQILSSISTAALDADKFTVPSDYRRTRMDMPTMPGMPGGRGR